MGVKNGFDFDYDSIYTRILLVKANLQKRQYIHNIYGYRQNYKRRNLQNPRLIQQR